MKAFLIFTLFVFCNSFIIAQENLTFRNFSTTDGLSDNEINCIAEDSSGFIWIGTNNGLNRFDGHKWLIFRKESAGNSICGNVITALSATSDGFLWIGTADGGACRYDTENMKFESFGIGHDNRAAHVLSLYAWSADSVLLAVEKEFTYRFNRISESFTAYNPGQSIFTNRIQLVKPDGNSILLAPLGRGLISFQNGMSQPLYTDSLVFPYPAHTISTLYQHTNGDVWFGAWDNGIYRYRRSDGFKQVATVFHQPFSYSSEEVTSITWHGKHLWLGTKNSGLLLFDTLTGLFSQNKNSFLDRNSIASNTIRAILKDSTGLIWIGTDQGMSLFDPRFALFSTIFPDKERRSVDFSDRVSGFAKTADHFYVATQKYLYQASGSHWQDFSRRQISTQEDELIYSLYASDQNQIYIGTNKTGYLMSESGSQPQLFKGFYSPGEGQQVYFNFFELESSRIVSFAQGQINGKDLLLMSVFGHGIGFFNPVTKIGFVNYLNLEEGFENLFNGFYSDSRNRLWILGKSKGLLKSPEFLPDSHYLDMLSDSGSCEGIWLTYQTDSIFSSSFLHHPNAPVSVVGMVENPDSTFYLATQDKGLVLFNPSGKGAFNPVPLVPNRLEGIARDRLGRIWVTTAGGLILYDSQKDLIHPFNNLSGLPEKGVQGAIYTLPDSTMVAGSFGSFVHFDPLLIQFPENKPRIKLTHLNIMNENSDSLLTHRRITLPHTQDLLTIAFTGFDYSGTDQIRYAYRLKGVTEDWLYTTSPAEATYSNLRGGNYTFEVTAVNSAGIKSDPALLSFRIIPPLWNRLWFKTMIVLVIIGLSWGFYRFRMMEIDKITTMRLQAEIEAQEKERRRLAQDLHDELGTRLSALKLYMGSMNNYLVKSSEAHEINENASTLLDESVKDLRGLLNNLSPDSVSRYGFFKALANLVAMINNSKALRAGLQITGNTFRFAQELALYRILQELINNSIKHSGCSKIDINILCDGDQIDLLYEDNGKGMDLQSQTTGLGFRNIKSRMTILKGNITWDSSPGMGFRAVIRINTKPIEPK